MDDKHLPPEVYEAVHGASDRRRRLAFRSVAALVVAGLLVGGFISWNNGRSDDKTSQTAASQNGSQGQPNQSGQSSAQQASQQPPQSNAPLPKSDSQPVAAPGDGTVNTATVRQPE